MLLSYYLGNYFADGFITEIRTLRYSNKKNKQGSGEDMEFPGVLKK